MVMFSCVGGVAGGKYAQAAGHAEVDEQDALGKMDEQVFGAPCAAQDGFAVEGAVQIGRDGVAQFRLADGGADDRFAGDVGRDAAQGGFDFGQFGHDVCVVGVFLCFQTAS